jgi:hypothetical protein
LQPSIAQCTVFITGDPSPRTDDAIASTGCAALLKPFLASRLIGLLRDVTSWAPARGVRIA